MPFKLQFVKTVLNVLNKSYTAYEISLWGDPANQYHFIMLCPQEEHS